VGLPTRGGQGQLGRIRLRFDPSRDGIASLGISGFTGDDDALRAAFDGLPVHTAAAVESPAAPNDLDCEGIELLSIFTSSATRTARAIEAATGSAPARVREHSGMVMGYVSLGTTQAEVVESADAPVDAATVGGMIIIVSDLAALSARLGPDLISEPRLAVQYERQIATFRPAAALGMPIAAMTPAPGYSPTPEQVADWRARRAAATRP